MRALLPSNGQDLYQLTVMGRRLFRPIASHCACVPRAVGQKKKHYHNENNAASNSSNTNQSASRAREI